MDIDLFSEIVKGLILDNDEVTLPGLGTFVSEVVPSAFSDKGYTINPPYRRLSFRQRQPENDRLLADFYAKANGIDLETSARIMSEFINGLKTTLQTKKIVVFPGLGRLRATKENTFFFIADEDLDIYLYGVGLEPVSLKTHEETPDEVAESVAALRDMIADPVAKEPDPEIVAPAAESEPDSEPEAEQGAEQETKPEAIVTEPEEPVAEPVETMEQPGAAGQPRQENMVSRRKHVWRVVLIVAACLIGLMVLALGIFMLLAHVAPDFIDSILYTPEELRIINY